MKPPEKSHPDPVAQTLAASLGATYEIKQELGGGGMSRVFLAHDRSLGREVVVKLLLPELAAGVSIARFRREIALAARLQHPNIVTVLTAGEANGLPFFTMPYVRGESLRSLLDRGERVEIRRAIRILRDVSCALARAHEESVVHRDIKPANILLSGGAAMVTDFGVATALTSAREPDNNNNTGDSTLTVAGTSLGTPDYISPEQATADPAMDHRSDIYSFGVTAYHLLAGHTPFKSGSHREAITAHLTQTPPSLASQRDDVPPALAALVMQCMEKDPAARPQSAEQIVDELDRISPDMPAGSPAATALRRPQWLTRAVIGLLVATSLGLAILNYVSRPSSDRVDGAAAQKGDTEVSAARDAYARGVDYFQRSRQDSANAPFLAPAIQAFEEAVRLDPRYAQAFAKLAEARFWWATLDPSDESRMASFNQALDSAIAIDPDLAEVRAAQALRLDH